MQGIQLVLVFGLLRQNALHSLQQVLSLVSGMPGQGVQLSLHITVHAAHTGAQRLERLAHALVLLGVGIAANLRSHARALAVVVLTQLQTMACSKLDQVLTACLQQSAVGRVRNRLGHDGGVHDHAIEAALFDQACRMRSLNRDSQQRFHAFFTNALAPARETGWVNRQFGLQVGLSSEELPVRVLQPGVDHGFIRCVIGMLQLQQPCHQSGRQRRASPAGSEMGREAAFNLFPIHQIRQAHQRVLHVELLVKTRAEQLARLRQCGLWLHLRNTVEICKESNLRSTFSSKFCTP